MVLHLKHILLKDFIVVSHRPNTTGGSRDIKTRAQDPNYTDGISGLALQTVLFHLSSNINKQTSVINVSLIFSKNVKS